MIDYHIFDEVYHRSSHHDEQNEHRDSLEEGVKDRIEQVTERNLENSYPFGTLKAIFFIECKVLVGPEDIDTDG